jgi:hypothetical protein
VPCLVVGVFTGILLEWFYKHIEFQFSVIKKEKKTSERNRKKGKK